ncbi:hypothetical protein M4D57_25865, partial [Brevibacillus borstelensis]|uniref:hypothetical protein n=1 Tax=Brevibacillus borstelensis TaxID=45462 RepID=UPI0020418742
LHLPRKVFVRGCLKTSPSWGEVLFLCSQTLVVQRVRNLQKAQFNKCCNFNDTQEKTKVKNKQSLM